MYRCSTVLSKKVKKAMGPDAGGVVTPPCPHCLYWGKRKDGRFALQLARSTLTHAPQCVAIQKVSRTELVHDRSFVKHSLCQVNVTGKTASKSVLGTGGRLDGSVHERTAKRASNDVKAYHDKDYDEDWSKIKPWGDEYERLNNNSRFDIKITQDNRSVIIGPG